MKKFIIHILCCIVLFTSCTTNEPEFNTNKEKCIGEFSMIVKYKGEYYNVKGIETADSVYYLNEKFNNIYRDEISKLPHKAMITYYDANGNQVVGYYKTVEELEKDNGITYISNNYYMQDGYLTKGSNDSTKVTPESGKIIGRAVLYDDTNYSDRRVIIDVSNEFFVCPHLKNLGGFNDKTSSIRVYNFHSTCNGYPVNITPPAVSSSNASKYVCLIGYEDNLYYNSVGELVHGDCDILYCVAKYTGNDHIKIPNSASHQDYKLKNIGWNDKITAVVLGIISSESIDKTIHPHE